MNQGPGLADEKSHQLPTNNTAGSEPQHPRPDNLQALIGVDTGNHQAISTGNHAVKPVQVKLDEWPG
jgi:hypothetical protein